MGLETENCNISHKSMEEIEIFKTAESPTGERIKLFVDELEALGPVEEPLPRYVPTVPANWAHANGVEFVVNIEEDFE